jgi:hypothetical protein
VFGMMRVRENEQRSHAAVGTNSTTRPVCRLRLLALTRATRRAQPVLPALVGFEVLGRRGEFLLAMPTRLADLLCHRHTTNTTPPASPANPAAPMASLA